MHASLLAAPSAAATLQADRAKGMGITVYGVSVTSVSNAALFSSIVSPTVEATSFYFGPLFDNPQPNYIDSVLK